MWSTNALFKVPSEKFQATRDSHHLVEFFSSHFYLKYFRHKHVKIIIMNMYQQQSLRNKTFHV